MTAIKSTATVAADVERVIFCGLRTGSACACEGKHDRRRTRQPSPKAPSSRSATLTRRFDGSFEVAGVETLIAFID
jgi:hypothetical protein